MLRNIHCVTDRLLKLSLGLFFSDNDASGWVVDDWPNWVMRLLYYVPTCRGTTHISVILYGIYLAYHRVGRESDFHLLCGMWLGLGVLTLRQCAN